MKSYSKLPLSKLQSQLEMEMIMYHKLEEMKLELDLSRGKPCKEQLELSLDMLNCLTKDDIANYSNELDLCNYGILDGVPEAKELFSNILDISPQNIFVGGNSSLNLMHDCISRAMNFGILGSIPWSKLYKVKFICPSPGYDRHFAICEQFNIEMISVEMTPNGPDMLKVAQLVESDESIKGMWCVPLYSNPQGVIYSNDIISKIACLKPKSLDFRIFWDNAYCMHHLTDNSCKITNLYNTCLEQGSQDMIYIFGSTSKITFSGSGISAFACSNINMLDAKKHISIQTIGYDKLNQYRHVKFFKNKDIKKHMRDHAEIILPKFKLALDILDSSLTGLEIASWNKPQGGYFISIDTLPGCAKETVKLCSDLGVKFTPAGATFPYGNDPKDSNIRIAPTYPSLLELENGINVFCTCLKISTLKFIINNFQLYNS